MESNEFLSRIAPALRGHLLSLAIGFLGIIFINYGIFSLIGKQDSQDIVFEKAEEKEEKEAKPNAAIFADIEGAVVNPGVYRLPMDARIQDVLAASGGLLDKADRDWVSKHVNLAQKIKDGFKMYIPEVGEQVSGSSVSAASDSTSSQININTASEAELDSLSGIGPVTSQKIIEGRPYESIEELKDRKIVSQSIFEKIKEKITVF